MMVIGVTGGMASGKSTVASMIAAHGFPHLDADALVHQLMREDAETIAAIGKKFPSSVSAGRVSRSDLSRLVILDQNALAELEDIIHPLVRSAEERAIKEARVNGSKAFVLDIPLLFETEAEQMCDKVIAVSATEEVRRARAFARPGMIESKFQRLMARQLAEAERNIRADVVVMNDGKEEDTRAQVDALLKTWGLT